MELRPAGTKVRALRRKLQALAERGVDGERAAARRKLAKLEKRYDFSVPAATELPDMFLGQFRRSGKATAIYRFERSEFDIANSVKWAIESGTKIRCLFNDRDLLAEAAVPTTKRLKEIANHIANSFSTLIDQFIAIDGVSADDRSSFVMGLYDGMMNTRSRATAAHPCFVIKKAGPQESSREHCLRAARSSLHNCIRFG